MRKNRTILKISLKRLKNKLSDAYLPTWVIYCSLISTFHMLHSRVMQFLFVIRSSIYGWWKFAVVQLRNCFQFSINLMKLSLSLALVCCSQRSSKDQSRKCMRIFFSTLSLHFVCLLFANFTHLDREMPSGE